ncbi:pentapeptide repeat-containing protein [Spirillospora sp. NBC_00431]
MDDRDLSADCANCFALCCAALPFARSADFAVDKAAGEPCRNLLADHRCGIHANLRERGFQGCTVFDCLGAGQKVSQVTFGARDWRHTGPDLAREMFRVFPVMWQLHEALWYLEEALTLPPAEPVRDDLRLALDDVDRLTQGTPGELTDLDLPKVRDRVNALLLHVSELVRSGVPGRKNRRGADLAGAKLKGADLRGADLRGACLIAADLRGADLRASDLIGADLRNADLRGADLTGAIFVTRSQLASARGDAATRLPAALGRPAHW